MDYELDTNTKILHIKTAKGPAWWSANYTDSDRGYTVYWDDNVDVSSFIWKPVASDGAYMFEGTFDGMGHSISDLTIDSQANYMKKEQR